MLITTFFVIKSKLIYLSLSLENNFDFWINSYNYHPLLLTYKSIIQGVYQYKEIHFKSF